MKRLLQFVALMLVLLVAAQPLLAGTACATQSCSGEHAMVACCMHSGGMAMSADGMQSMRAACTPAGGHRAVVTAGCSDPGCGMASADAAVVVADPSKSSIVSDVTPLAAVAEIAASVAPVLILRPSEDAAAPATARYILLQTFRI
ncbi:MAG TPA: hypothetical protein VGB94_14375 [Acidobacteriaceae bacterium]